MMQKTNTFTTSSQLSWCVGPLATGISVTVPPHKVFYSVSHYRKPPSHQPRDQVLLETSKAWLLGPRAQCTRVFLEHQAHSTSS